MNLSGEPLRVQVSSNSPVPPMYAPIPPIQYAPYQQAPQGCEYSPRASYFEYPEVPQYYDPTVSNGQWSERFHQTDSGVNSPVPQYTYETEPPQDEEQEVEDITPGMAGIRLAEPDAPKPVDEYISRNMHLKWFGTFSELFNKNCHMGTTWELRPVFEVPTENRHRLFVYHDTAKVRFSCYDCGKSWTSVKGNVVFWISKDSLRNIGIVQFKLYGQRCTECNPDIYEHAIWYEEEVERVLRNLYNRVIALYYGVKQQPRESNVRWARPRQPHNPESCSACADGICSSRRQGNRTRQNSRQQKVPFAAPVPPKPVLRSVVRCPPPGSPEPQVPLKPVVSSLRIIHTKTEHGGIVSSPLPGSQKVAQVRSGALVRQRSLVE